MEDEEGSKELIVECVDEGFKGFVEVLASHTLHDLRQLLVDEFDDDMLPAEYYFTCDGVRYSTKQENRRKLWDLIHRKAAVCIHDKNRGQKRGPAAPAAPADPHEAGANKKVCSPREDSVVGQEARVAHSDPSTDSPGVEAIVLSRGSSQEDEVKATKASQILATPTRIGKNNGETRSPSPPVVGRGQRGAEGANKPEGDERGRVSALAPPLAPSQAGGSVVVVENGRLDEGTPLVSNKTSDVLKGRPLSPSAARKAIPFALSTLGAISNPGTGSSQSLRIDTAAVSRAAAESLGSGNKKSGATHGTASSNENLANHSSSTAPADDAASVSASAPSSEPEAAAESSDSEPAGSVDRASLRPVATTSPVQNGNDDDDDGIVVDNDDDDDDDDVVDMDDDDDGVALVIPSPPPRDTNDAQREAREKSCQVLNDLQALLNDNPLFCSQERREDFEEEIREGLKSTAPRVVVGVLGSTGVGKSSLLNALLDEAAVLPTSGSRGCTAAVVELSFNQELVDPPAHAETVPVYRGKVEFMRPQDWEAELRVLVDECSTQDKKICTRRPDPDSSPDASAAWDKIDQVYGQGTMDGYKGDATHTALASLLRNRRVSTLLAPKDGQEYNSVAVEAGAVDIGEASLLLGGFDKLNRRMRRSVKSWAQAFRRKINDYVYRKGNGTDPQTWPLIRCVTLQGPWNVLASGACLVDLPGVRDANAARARVSERYLQNCSQIWVVAPIKRAVDDGTAKELLGEQFKRRLLMDGQYGNVSFICTQTDDCEATEIMRDHADVAQAKPGRWERMTNLLDKISNVDVELSGLLQQEEDLEVKHEEAVSLLNDVKGSEEDSDDSDSEVGDTTEHDERDSLVEEAREKVSEALVELTTWRSKNVPKREKLHQKSHKLQRQLKALCAQVRNEYSASCLKEDFINGLKDLYRDEDGDVESGKKVALPDDLDLNVFCISANDYLKIQGIKPTSDGPPNCFSTANETQIPSLRSYVHEVTATHRTSFFELFANQVSDIVDRFKLLATEAESGGSTRLSRKCRNTFATEMRSLEQEVKSIGKSFRSRAGGGVNLTLQPSLRAGASKGHASAIATIDSWGSSSRRTRTERYPNKNGLYWATYQATVRRGGEYVSPSAGSIDFNQELCDPMEKEFSPAWQSVMDGSLRLQIVECETKIQEMCCKVERALAQGFAACGMDRARLASLATAASRNGLTALRAWFQAIRQVASDSQRDLNRSLLPKIQEQMSVGYEACQNVPRGTGVFSRMKKVLHDHGSQSIHGMFNESISELLTSIRQLVDRIATMISGSFSVVRKALEGVYALCWEDQCDVAASNDPVQLEQIRQCRDSLLPELGRLRSMQDSAMNLLGIEREELELDLIQVDTFMERQAKIIQQAIDKGELVDLCDTPTDASKAVKSSPSAECQRVPRASAAPVQQRQPTMTQVASQPLPEQVYSTPLPCSTSFPYSSSSPYSRPLPYPYGVPTYGVPQSHQWSQWSHGYGNGQNSSFWRC